MFAAIPTERLLLRSLTADDLGRFVEYRNDAVAVRMQGWPAPFTTDDARRFIASSTADAPGRQGEWFLIAIADRTTDRLIGDIGLFTTDSTSGSIGYTLHPDCRGSGYAIEAVRAAIDFAFESLGFTSLEADTLSDNQGSLRVLHHAGFVRSPTRAGRIADLSTDDRDVFELDYRCTPETLRRHPPVIGLLTGGRSTRMGSDKATTEIAGRPMALWVAEACASTGIETVVLGPDDAGTDLPCVGDDPAAETPAGPLRGLTAALDAFPERSVILAATDQPYVQPTTLLQLALQPDTDVVVPLDEGYPQVTTARYGPSVARFLRPKPPPRLRDLIDLGEGHIIRPDVWKTWGEDGRSFRSLDRPADIEAAIAQLGFPGPQAIA